MSGWVIVRVGNCPTLREEGYTSFLCFFVPEPRFVVFVRNRLIYIDCEYPLEPSN